MYCFTDPNGHHDPSSLSVSNAQHVLQSWMRSMASPDEHAFRQGLLDRWIGVLDGRSFVVLTGQREWSWAMEGDRWWFNADRLSGSEIGLWSLLFHRLQKEKENPSNICFFNQTPSKNGYLQKVVGF